MPAALVQDGVSEIGDPEADRDEPGPGPDGAVT